MNFLLNWISSGYHRCPLTVPYTIESLYVCTF